MFTIKQISRLAGITPRTLHYYDEIGLLRPARVGENGYRYYGEESLMRLQQILLYRELGLPLEQIGQIMASSDYDALAALENHREELRKRIAHIERLINTVNHTISVMKGQTAMDSKKLFDGFNAEEEAKYEQEAMAMYDPATVKASYQRWRGYTAADKQRIADEGNAVYEAFLKAMPKGAASPEAQACVGPWRKHMDYFWTPNDEQLLGIANGYADDPRFKATFDKIHPDLAEFIRDVVTIYMERKGN